MPLVVFGAAGQLGRELLRLKPDAVGLTRADADLIDPAAVRRVFEMHRPTVAVNCAAYNLVDKAESEPDAAFAGNAWAVRTLAECCREFGAKLVHVSSDYVFGLDSGRNAPFTETDLPGPVSVYGLSKLAGEYVALAGGPRNLAVRTCGLYGRFGVGGKGGNFVETMLRVAGQGKPLRVVNDQRCSPTSTADLAATLLALIEANAAGLFHAVNAGGCTWYEFAAEIFRASGVAADLTPITSAEFGAKARRPAYSVLDCGKLRTVGVAPPRPWQSAVSDYLRHRPG